MTAKPERSPNPFTNAIAGLSVCQPAPFFVQIGSCDGFRFDPLPSLIGEHHLSGVIVEHAQTQFEKLNILYNGSTKIKPIKCMITANDGPRTVYRFKPEAIRQGLLPHHFARISAATVDAILIDPRVTGPTALKEETRELLRKLIEAVEINGFRFGSLFKMAGVSRIDILRLEAEIHNFSLINLFDFNRWRPAIVYYGHQHLSPSDRRAALDLMTRHGYNIIEQLYDTLAILRPGVVPINREAATAILDLGNRLFNEGRLTDAFTLSDHLASLAGQTIPGSLLLRARCHNDQNRMLDAAADLRRFRDLTGSLSGLENLTVDIFNKSNVAIHQLQRENRFDEAADIAENLVALTPGWAPMVANATRLMSSLGRTEEATRYARQLLKLEPENEMANQLLFWDARQAGDKTAQRQYLLRLAEIKQSDNPPHVRLQLFLGLLNLLLAPMKAAPGDIQLARHIASRAEKLTDAEIQDDETAKNWFRFFHLIIQAVMMEQELGENPVGQATAPTSCVSSTGSVMSTFDITMIAQKIGAKAVFLVAADEKYFRLYARIFALSALKNSDVPCLIIIHVIGGHGRLVQLANSLGIVDDRLILTADDFDPAAVTTICVDAPPDNIAAVPLAHFQSVRFAQADYLLSSLELPIFISDIDCILLMGVHDLLQKTKQNDIVFNYNDIGKQVGDVLTANLLLMNPTQYGKMYAGFLRDYLYRALKKQEVSRWIDQIALLMIVNHAQINEIPINFGYFENEYDINNGMYRSIPDKPFRFLSLFRTFDLDSLEPKIREWEEALSVSRQPWPPAL